MADAPKLQGTERISESYYKINMGIDNANEALRKSYKAEEKSVVAEEKSNAADTLSKSVQQQLNGIVVEGSIDPETKQIRVDANSVVYGTAKERIDAEQLKIDRLKKNWVSVLDFGAKGDGVTDDTNDIQAAINYIKDTFGDQGGTVFFPIGEYKFSTVLISSKHIKLTGSGTLKGTVLIRSVERANPSYDNNIKDLFTRVEGLRFVHNVGNNTDAIVIRNTRCVNVSDCYFQNYRYAIHGEAIHNDVPYQQTARVIISDCMYYDVDMAVRTSWSPYTSGVPSTWVYSQHGDWQVKGCQAYFYIRGLTHFHFEGQDGLIIINNILFHRFYRLKPADKMYNVYVKQSNFTIISNNDLFEAGLESIYCEDMRSLIISNNNMAWCGQREPSSGIYLEVTDKATYQEASVIVSGNNIAYPTRHGINAGYNTVNIKISDNVITKHGDSKFYYGSVDLSTISHYPLFVGDPAVPFPEQNSIITSKNTYRGSIFQNRGIAENYSLDFVDTNKTFGNVNATPRTISGTLDLSTIITKNSNPFNQNFPFILKGVTGNINDIVGNVGQIVTIICGGGGTLTLNNSGVGNNLLNLGANISLNPSQYVTLQKTDSYWIKM